MRVQISSQDLNKNSRGKTFFSGDNEPTFAVGKDEKTVVMEGGCLGSVGTGTRGGQRREYIRQFYVTLTQQDIQELFRFAMKKRLVGFSLRLKSSKTRNRKMAS